MPRSLGDLAQNEREEIVARVQREAEDAGWHLLNNRDKSALYQGWAERFDLKHQAVKDGIMKGFDVAQGIPPSGEAAIHAEIRELFTSASVPYWGSKIRLWGGRAQADFVIGFSRRFLTHIAELEPAPNWQAGLMQALWYKSAYLHESGIQAIPTVILFGDVSPQRWREIETTCLDQRALVLAYRLFVSGTEASPALAALLQ